MTPELEPVTVLADRLQADGDSRGELLALELAAAHADTLDESRRLCAEASAVRARHAKLAFPPALAESHGLLRAGLLVAGRCSNPRDRSLLASLGPHCRDLIAPVKFRGLQGVQDLLPACASVGSSPDGLWEDRHASNYESLRPVRLELDHAFELRALGIIRPPRDPAVLQQLHGLEQLDLGRAAMTADLLGQLPKLALRSLAVRVQSSIQLTEMLEACPLLEHLTLHHFDGPLPPIAGLERLRSLALLPTNSPRDPAPRLPDVRSLPRLESLVISSPDAGDLERIAALGLRSLVVMYNPEFTTNDGANDIVAALARLDTLEHLGLLWDRRHIADIAPLSRLTRLRSLELSGVLNGDFHAPVTLERLCVSRWDGHARIHGAIPRVHTGANSVFSLQCELARVQTLGLSARHNYVDWLVRSPDRFAAVETLMIERVELDHAWVAALRKLPRLRTVIWPLLSIGQQRAAAEALPHVQIVGADAARLRQDWPVPTSFDLLAPSNWPKF